VFDNDAVPLFLHDEVQNAQQAREHADAQQHGHPRWDSGSGKIR
jgi:hypothetical protein